MSLDVSAPATPRVEAWRRGVVVALGVVAGALIGWDLVRDIAIALFGVYRVSAIVGGGAAWVLTVSTTAAGWSDRPVARWTGPLAVLAAVLTLLGRARSTTVSPDDCVPLAIVALLVVLTWRPWRERTALLAGSVVLATTAAVGVLVPVGPPLPSDVRGAERFVAAYGGDLDGVVAVVTGPEASTLAEGYDGTLRLPQDRCRLARWCLVQVDSRATGPTVFVPVAISWRGESACGLLRSVDSRRPLGTNAFTSRQVPRVAVGDGWWWTCSD